MTLRALWAVLPVLLLVGSSMAAPGGHYVPQTGDQFHYTESIGLGGGTGNYSEYTESTAITGTVGVTSVLPNGTESASYSNSVSYSNNQGGQQSYSSSGSFTFSASTFLYVNGTDNQTGYTDPTVWFYMNNELSPGSPFTILNTAMTVVATGSTYQLGPPLSEYVQTIFSEGNGSYERNDDYGVFSATYNWKAYFDPTTGYVVGYLYTEHDTDGAGDGFTITDALYVTSTSYALTVVSAPPATGGTSSSTPYLLVGLLVGIVIIVVLVVVLLLARSRRPRELPRHSGSGSLGYGPPPGAPPAIHLTPSGQPAVQQIVLRETVKVNCRYCGALIDTTATACPNCGAPRT